MDSIQTTMSQHEVDLTAEEGLFEGLAKQNLLFHQCIRELVDNSIGAKLDDQKFKVDILFKKKNDDVVTVYISDNGMGMPFEVFKKALTPGKSATTHSRLNEHGFGLKNALATLSYGTNHWKIWSRDKTTDKISSVESPFKTKMIVEDNDKFPNVDYLPAEADITTLIEVDVKKSFIKSVQGRGAKAADLNKLRKWLVEHLGVYYRGYLEQDKETLEIDGMIKVSIENDTVQVPPIPVPMGKREISYLDIELAGTVYHLEYHHGVLDEVRRDTLVKGEKAKFYYQGNQQTQGIDIRLGKRVIATQQLESIWHTDDEENPKPIIRHNQYNEFVGELLIPELPRKVLTTTNNKTDFNLMDEDWQKIFENLRNFKPVKNARSKSETELRKAWMAMIKHTNDEDEVADHISVWPTGVRIDVYRKTKGGDIIIYELKVGTGSPLDLYQLRMYWDGLVLNGQQPKEGILLVEDFHNSLEQMSNIMNTLPPPKDSKPYNFKIEKYSAKGL